MAEKSWVEACKTAARVDTNSTHVLRRRYLRSMLHSIAPEYCGVSLIFRACSASG
jgi:hypothetical protein